MLDDSESVRRDRRGEEDDRVPDEKEDEYEFRKPGDSTLRVK